MFFPTASQICPFLATNQPLGGEKNTCFFGVGGGLLGWFILADVVKVRGAEPYMAILGVGFFPYISRIHTAYIGEYLH